MAQIYYELINTPTLEIGGETYTCQTYRMNFGDFLLANAGHKIYIHQASLGTDEIRAIVIKDENAEVPEGGSYEHLQSLGRGRSKH